MDRRSTQIPLNTPRSGSPMSVLRQTLKKKRGGGRKEEKERVRVSAQAVISMDLKLRGEVITSGCHLFASNILLLAYSL